MPLKQVPVPDTTIHEVLVQQAPVKSRSVQTQDERTSQTGLSENEPLRQAVHAPTEWSAVNHPHPARDLRSPLPETEHSILQESSAGLVTSENKTLKEQLLAKEAEFLSFKTKTAEEEQEDQRQFDLISARIGEMSKTLQSQLRKLDAETTNSANLSFPSTKS